MNKQPFLTPNPQDFKLRIVWSVDSVTKMVAEFSNCKWLPRIGETLVLPIDEKRQSNSWRKFKVFDVVYDFHSSTTKVLCSPVKCSTPTSFPSAAKDAMSIFKEFDDKVEAQIKAMETREAKWKAEATEREAQLEYEFSQLDSKDVDEELARLKKQVLD